MKRGLILILVIILLIISACGKLEWERLSCTEGETRCSSSHDSIIQCGGGSWGVIQNCADPNPVCKVVSGAPQCTTNSAPVVNAGSDFSVSGNTGTLLNFGSASSTWPAGKIGTGLFFNNGYNRVEVPDSASLDFRDKITVSAWVKFNYFSTLTTWNLIATKGDTSNERAFGMWVIDTGEDIGEILLSYKGENQSYYNFQAPGFTLGTWNHIVGIIDTANNYMEIYINNVRYRSTGTTDLPPIKINNFPVYIGGINGVWETIGNIDEIAILNDALNADEVNQAYQSYQSGIRPGFNIERLQLYYTLDEGAGTTAGDSSNNIGKTVTLSGGATDPDNDTLSYRWSVVSAPVTNFEYGDQKILNPWFVPAQSGAYTFRLIVGDGVTTISDDVSITVGDGVTNCTDGTPYNSCSITKPLFCTNNETLINDCQVCGCDPGKTCQTDGSCVTFNTTCVDGTPYNSCSITKPLFCTNNETLINDCQVCGCDPGKTCQTDGSCLPTTCSDGTLYNSCSTTNPLFCDNNGNLINDCQNCGCSSGLFCQGDGSCTTDKCITLVKNGDPATKLDVVFIGDDYTQDQLGIFASDVNNFMNGILSYEPFTSQSYKINFYRVDNTKDLKCSYGCNGTAPSHWICCSGPVISEVSNCPSGVVIVIVNDDTYGGAAFGSIGVSYRGDYRVGVHEFGHAFGDLYDEYSYGETTTGVPGTSKNCAGDSSCSQWSNLMGVRGVGCYQICSYTNWYRPINVDSIMKNNRGDFNPVGERWLIQRMEAYS